MAATNIKGGRVADGTITRDDLNDTTTTKAVIKKVTAQNGVRIASSSGVDAGTGDVVLEADLTYLSTKYPSLLTNQTQNYVFAAPASGAGNPVFRALVAGDIPSLPVSAIANLQSLLDAKPNDWASLSGKPTTFAPTAHTHTIGNITDLATQLAAKQPLDADLTAIAALSGASGLPRKTALNTWVLDTATYLTANQNITIWGDATGSGTTAIALTLASVATAGTYRSVTIDAKGRVTSGTNPTTMAAYGLTSDFATQWDAIWNSLSTSGIGNIFNIIATNATIGSLSTGTLSVDGQFVDGGFSEGTTGQFLQSFGAYTLWTNLTTALISDFTANVLGQTLDGFVVGSATELTDTDTILSGFQNLQAQVFNKLESSEIVNYWKNGGNDVTADWSFSLNDGSGAVHDYYWSVNNVEKMRLTAAGNLGVGITPEAVIHAHATVVGNAEVIALKASNEVSATSFFSIGINASNNRTNLYAGGEVWATTISKWKFGAADVVGVWNFQTLPTSSTTPTAGNQFTNKTYVDSLSFVKRGDVVKTISLTNITLSGTQTVNGYALVVGNLCLVAGQTTGANNGVYVVAAGAWTRATTNDADAEIRGAYHFITNGTYANQRYINTNASAITVGTTAITYGIDFGAETDPVWVAFRDANSISSTSITNWNSAFGWGNHASAGYVNVTGDQTIGGIKTFSSQIRVLAASNGSDFKIADTVGGIVLSHNDNLIWQIAKASQSGHFGIAMGGSSSLTFALFHKGLRLGLNNSTFIKPTEILDVVGNITITGVLKINTVAPATGQFLRATSPTVMAWAGLTVGDIPDLSATYLSSSSATANYATKMDAVMLGTYGDERGFMLYSDNDKTIPQGQVTSNPDAGIAIGMYGYQIDDSFNQLQFGLQLNRNDGKLYHYKTDGTAHEIITTETMVSGGGGDVWNGGDVTGDVNYQSPQRLYWNKIDNSNYDAILYASDTGGHPLLHLSGRGEVWIHADNFLDLASSAGVCINNNIVDLSNISSFLGGNVKFAVSFDNSPGVFKYRLSLVAA